MAFFTKRYHAPGTPPGTLSMPVRIEDQAPRIQLINYTEEAITVRDGIEASGCRAYLDASGVTWVHVAGRPTQSVLEELGSARVLRLPMQPGSRSLNLSNAVAVVLFEAWRQLGFEGGQ